MISRRKFIALLGGGAAPWPAEARAQQGGQVRRIGMLNPGAAGDPDVEARIAGFQQGLQKLGGPTAATCASNIAGVRAMPTSFAGTRQNW